MTQSQQLASQLQAERPIFSTPKRLQSVLIAVLAIGLATGAAFVALLWLDGSMRFLTPSVIRLGAGQAPAQAVRIAHEQAR
jgi:hypothetical protein